MIEHTPADRSAWYGAAVIAAVTLVLWLAFGRTDSEPEPVSPEPTIVFVDRTPPVPLTTRPAGCPPNPFRPCPAAGR